MKVIGSILQWRTLVLVNFGLTTQLADYSTSQLINQSPCAVFPVCFFCYASFSLGWRDYTVKKHQPFLVAGVFLHSVIQ